MSRRMIVIGAGPMGLEAALLGLEHGYEVTVLERERVGASLRRWGSTKLFTPVRMNISPRVAAVLGPELPPAEALLTGPETVERILEPLVQRAPLAGRVRTQCRVLSVGRARMTRTEMAHHPLRAERPFRVLVEGEAGEEVLLAEAVLDASGVYGRPAWLGAGGPAIGERALAARLIRHLGTLEERLPSLGGKRLLLVGHGHSAANALAVLEPLAARETQVVWAVKSGHGRPCQEVANDPLPERQRVVSHANHLAERPPSFLRVERRASVERLLPELGGSLSVQLSGGRSLSVDEVLGFTGYRPDLEMVEELAAEISPVSEGAGRLHKALATVTDCLAVPKLGEKDLLSGEPGFHLVGSKSYGRLPTFLLQTGIAQLEAVFAALKREGRE